MQVYVVYPTPLLEDGSVQFDPARLPMLRDATHAHGLRVNLHPRSAHNDRIVSDIKAAGLSVLPILDLDYDGSIPALEYGRWCADIAERAKFLRVELGNEPWTTGHVIDRQTTRRMPALEYATYVRSASDYLRRLPLPPRIAIACDVLRPTGYRHPEWTMWWRDVTRHVSPMTWDDAAIHPYRSPLPPRASRIEWARWMHRTPWIAPLLGFAEAGMRDAEHRWWRETANAPMIVTETGWSRHHVSDEVAAGYLREELEFYRDRKVAVVCVYAYGGDEWGVLNDDGSPRLQADAIRRFVEEQQ